MLQALHDVPTFQPEDFGVEFVMEPGSESSETHLRMRFAARACVSDKLARLPDLKDGEDALFGECRALARHAAGVAELATAADLTAMADVANGIQETVDSLMALGLWHVVALKLHLDALRAFNSPAVTAADEAAILERLRNLRADIGVGE